MVDPWPRRLFWLLAVLLPILLAVEIANGVSAKDLRAKLDTRDQSWQKRLDGLEYDVRSLQRANLGQDDYNTEFIKQRANEKQANRTPNK